VKPSGGSKGHHQSTVFKQFDLLDIGSSTANNRLLPNGKPLSTALRRHTLVNLKPIAEKSARLEDMDLY